MSNRACRNSKLSKGNAGMTISMLAAMLVVGWSVDHLCADQKICRWVPIAGFDDPSMASYTDTYFNSDYEFKVSIPNGLIGHSSPPPAPNHGFGILLGKRGDGYVEVDGSANSLEYESSEIAVRNNVGFLKDRGAIISKSRMNRSRLGGFTATRLTVWYHCPGSDEMFVKEQVVALSPDKSPIWVVGLDTKQSRYEKDRRVFESILKSWEHNPLPQK